MSRTLFLATVTTAGETVAETRGVQLDGIQWTTARTYALAAR